MQITKIALAVALILTSLTTLAQEYESTLSGVDYGLFYSGYQDREENQPTKYYSTPVEVRRRGLDWWLAEEVMANPLALRSNIASDIGEIESRARVTASTKDYYAGVMGRFAKELTDNWNLALNIDYRTGRDANISGVFRDDIRAEIASVKSFGTDHYLQLSLEIPHLMRGMQYASSAEAIELTGDNLYNPMWGFYDGKIRNSRVSRYNIPELNLRYQRPLGRYDGSHMAIEAHGESGRRSLSRLGWYDAYNPMPDYYRKLPSYASSESMKDETEEVWRSEDPQYTQIPWDRLVTQNRNTQDGAAHYVVEDMVTRKQSGEIAAIVSSRISHSGLTLRYGTRLSYDKERRFKELSDLLGADYLLDCDLFIGDYVTLDNMMQNDLQNPNRHIVEGDEFGYNYSTRSLRRSGILGIEYQDGRFVTALRASIGRERLQRIGHYEKERFEGSASLGASKPIKSDIISADVMLRYLVAKRHNIVVRGSINRLPNSPYDLFIEIQSANRTIDQLSSKEFTTAAIEYNFATSKLQLEATAYYMRQRSGIDLQRYYDDYSYTFADAVVSNIGMRSLGIEAQCNWQINRKISLSAALDIGDYTYDTTPTVTLYDDVDLDLFSQSRAIGIKGCKVGNAPQYLATLGTDIFAAYGVIFSLDCSYAAGRYVAPSFVRRTERMIDGAGSPALVRDILRQENLGSALDISLGCIKTIFLSRDRHISIYGRINNLLGDRNRIDYGREANRMLKNNGTYVTGLRYTQASNYSYCVGRTLYISCSLNW